MDLASEPNLGVDVLFRPELSTQVGKSISRLAQQTSKTPNSSPLNSDVSDLVDYRLTVSGLCSRTHQFSLSALRENFDVRQFYGNGPSSGLQTWTGCSLSDVLEFVGNVGQATDILLVGTAGHWAKQRDEHSAVLIPVDFVAKDNVLIAWSADGSSLGNGRRGSTSRYGPVDAIIVADSHTHRVSGLSHITLASVGI